ncbi:MAG TPA: hypothetical protein VEA37_02930 [Flavobacterium sp.]|nr:hypothetical protein [Flavobacterium sp.]
MKRLIRPTLYSIIAFCVVSYISVMVSLLSSVGDPQVKPVTNIGFPFSYYYQFWLNGNDSSNCGWNGTAFLLDCAIIWICTLSIYFMYRHLKKTQ